MNLNFKNKNLIAVFLLIISALFLIFNGIKNNVWNLDIKYLGKAAIPIRTNIEFLNNFENGDNKISISYDNKISNFNSTKNNSKFIQNTLDNNYPISKLQLKIQKNSSNEIFNNIKTLSVFIGTNYYYFNNNEIKKWDKIDSGENFISLSFPTKIKYKNNTFYNYKGNLHLFVITFLSLFYMWQLFIIPYILIFLAYLIYQKNKDSFNLTNIIESKNNWIFVIIILFLAFLLRVNSYDFYSMWPDELFTIIIASNPFNHISNMFLDGGNPPLFYLLLRIWFCLFGVSIFSARLITIIIGIASVFTIYLMLKELFGTKHAYLGMFLTTINFLNIFYSQELRCYIFSIFLIPLAILFFVEYIDNTSFKNAAKYFLIAAILVNTHYYCCLYIFANFVFGIIYLCKNSLSKAKDLISFFKLNFLILLSTLPYILLLLHIYNKNVFADANLWWMPKWSLSLLVTTIDEYFYSVAVILIFIIIVYIIFLNNKYNISFIKNNIISPVDKKQFVMLTYCLFIIISIFILASLVTIFKPIFAARYFSVLVPIIITFQTLLILLPWNLRYKELFVVILFFISINMSINMPIKKWYPDKLNVNPKTLYVEDISSCSKFSKNIFKGWEVHSEK